MNGGYYQGGGGPNASPPNEILQVVEKRLSREPEDETVSAESTEEISSPKVNNTTAETSGTLTPQEEIKPICDCS